MFFSNDYSVIAVVGGLIGGFGLLALLVRIGLELSLWDKEGVTWMPLADWLLIGATALAFFGVLIPSVLASSFAQEILSRRIGVNLPVAACIAACVLVGMYVPAILAHYAPLGIPGTRFGAPDEPDEAVGAPDRVTDREKILVEVGFVMAGLVFAFLFLI